jgi:hypothetical protein
LHCFSESNFFPSVVICSRSSQLSTFNLNVFSTLTSFQRFDVSTFQLKRLFNLNDVSTFQLSYQSLIFRFLSE